MQNKSILLVLSYLKFIFLTFFWLKKFQIFHCKTTVRITCVWKTKLYHFVLQYIKQVAYFLYSLILKNKIKYWLFIKKKLSHRFVYLFYFLISKTKICFKYYWTRGQNNVSVVCNLKYKRFFCTQGPNIMSALSFSKLLQAAIYIYTKINLANYFYTAVALRHKHQLDNFLFEKL